MATYNTGNPIGSKDPRDLYDNAENLDVAVNDDAATWVDRLGVQRSTLWQMLEYSKQFNDRGDWHTSTAYARKDYFTYGGVAYVTLTAHTSTSVAADLAAGKIGVMSGNSGAMDFLQAGIGAVARSVESKLRDVVNVKDFGAVGDGVTDDTAAFLAAIATIPMLSSLVIESDGTQSNVLPTIFEIPPGIYKITQTLLFTNKAACVFRGGGMTGLSSPAAVVLEWHGVADQTLIHIDGGLGVCLEQMALRGRGIAGRAILFTRSNNGYGRGAAEHKQIVISAFKIAGIQFGLADYPNLDQTDNITFTDISIHSCYDGIASLNRNNLNISFVNLSISHSYPIGGIVPRRGISLLKGGISVYNFTCGGVSGEGFSDYAIYLEDAYINVFGGYTEDEKLIKAVASTTSGQTVTSTFFGFNQYPATTSATPGIYWNQANAPLSWFGGRLNHNLDEGANSAGIYVTNAKFHNVPNWPGRTAKSAVVNCYVGRTAVPSESFLLNWLGVGASESAVATADYVLSNNIMRQDNFFRRFVDNSSALLRLLDGGIKLYHAGTGGSGFYQTNYSSFTEFFNAGYHEAQGKWFGNGVNKIAWAVIAPNWGSWVQGDVVWKTNAAAGQPAGWICVSSGSFIDEGAPIPVFKAMANLAA